MKAYSDSSFTGVHTMGKRIDYRFTPGLTPAKKSGLSW